MGDDYWLMCITRAEARFDHPGHPMLRASGTRGHFLGILGTGLILLNLAYLLRRHLPSFRRAGPLRHWMTLHVFAGTVGFALVTFHAGFRTGNPFTVAAFGSLVLLVLTGFVGRTVYALVHHDRRGEETRPEDEVRNLIERGIDDPNLVMAQVRRSELARRILGTWRDVHRPLAMMMATAAVAHVAVAMISRLPLLAESPFAVHVWAFGLAGAVLAAFVTLEIVLVRRRRRRARGDLEALVRSELAGLNEPPSLHPVVDLSVCMGSAACVASCPEGDILGLVNGRAWVVRGARCVGHGRCAAECPTGAIQLVFGSLRRGVDLPMVNSHFETDVPGIYITGELGGMGLVRNAIRQSFQAVDHIAANRPRGVADILDLLVIGAGPAGMSAALRARELGLSVEILDQEALGGTIAHYPRQKVVMTEPFTLPGGFGNRSRILTKEQLLEIFASALEAAHVTIRESVRVEEVRRNGDLFEVPTDRGILRAGTVMLCIGRRGSPRRLDVPGEELPKVAYRLIEPDQYAARHMLVVGGGDSAVEAALALADAKAASVTLSYRRSSVAKVREANQRAFQTAVAEGRITFEGETEVSRILADIVVLRRGSRSFDLPNDFVIVQIGGELPSEFLGKIGISIQRKFGTA
jgi:thioredoxin reductase/Pyruvate/2-oxoacid:ferredoxin oxidoreductase delta subunit